MSNLNYTRFSGLGIVKTVVFYNLGCEKVRFRSAIAVREHPKRASLTIKKLLGNVDISRNFRTSVRTCFGYPGNPGFAFRLNSSTEFIISSACHICLYMSYISCMSYLFTIPILLGFMLHKMSLIFRSQTFYSPPL